MGEWQPIDTAPRLGPKILLWWKHGGIGIGYWDCDDQWQERKWAHQAVKEGWRCDGDACIPVNQADCTHWMPQPTPPLL